MLHWLLRRHGWEFSLSDCDCKPSCTWWWNNLRLEQKRFKVALHMSDLSLCIAHRDSGLQFVFRPCDALRRWIWEKFHRGDGFVLPTYDSPLLPVGFDSAYVGRLLFTEKPGEKPCNIDPKWEDIDWETLHERIVWANMHDKIFGKPFPGGPGKFKARVEKRAKERAVRIAERKSKIEESQGRRKEFEVRDLQDALVNMELPFYLDDQFDQDGTTSCYLNLVVTERGWFFSQRQLARLTSPCSFVMNLYSFLSQLTDLQNFEIFQRLLFERVERIREMTMHCGFGKDIIYREIIERQSKDYLKRLRQVSKWLGENQHLEANEGMHLHFHEVKQLVFKGAFGRLLLGFSTVHDASRRYSSFVSDEIYGKMNRLAVATSDVFDDQIELLFLNSGEQIELIGKETGTCVQIIPLFRHPCDPTIQVVRRKAYIYGLSKYNVDRAKSRIADLLGETTQLCSMETETKMQRKAKMKAKADTSLELTGVILSDVATIFGQA